MSTRSSRRFPVRRHQVVVADIGCGCRHPKLSSIFYLFSRRSRTKDDPYSPSSITTSLWDTTAATTTTTATTSSRDSTPPTPPLRKHRPRNKKNKASEDTVEVVKESSEPYLDFKESMLQMIVENEMYGWDELNELLHRLLVLNDVDTHPLILRAFADIWSGILAPANY